MPIFPWMYFPLWMLQRHNAVEFMSIFPWMYFPLWMLQRHNAVEFMSIFPWMYFPLWMLQRHNAVEFMPIFPWMHLPLQMSQRRNSVRVVLLIARGWRGTSLPRVNVCKEMQRCKCWAFSMKTRLQWNISWRITQRNRNTYGVDPRTTYTNPG